MLITVSGMVGSGKSTVSKRIVELVVATGNECRYVRFRSFGLFGFRSSPIRSGAVVEPAPSAGAARWSGFRPRTLTFVVACGYAARILAFRAFGPRRSAPVCYVLDRYFYDSFVHYALRSTREWVYAAALARIIPRPDLAILLTASPETLRERRPDYDAGYLSAAGLGYSRLPGRFPALVSIATDAGHRSDERLEAVVADLLEHSGHGPRSSVRKEAV